MAMQAEIEVAPAPWPRKLVDVAKDARAAVGGRLDKVGMSEIEMPVRLATPGGIASGVPARVDAFVSLDDPDAKGIHMSRLFLHLQEVLEKEVLDSGSLETMLRGFVDSHRDISAKAFADLRFEYMLRRPALLSEHAGWRSYPVELSGALENGVFRAWVSVRVTYSSTCPCSAALARQHVREQFLDRFGSGSVSADAVASWLESEAGVTATPHSQRSHADVRVEIDPENPPAIADLVDELEECLGTPVQAAVKRIDEQEFARRNGTNPMFCEDAARRVKHALATSPAVRSFQVEIEHQESLHAHNAVSRVSG